MSQRYSLLRSSLLTITAGMALSFTPTANAKTLPPVKSKMVTTSVPTAMSDTALLLPCKQISDNVGRLACFDKVVQVGISDNSKQPLDIVKTVETSIAAGKPVAVLGNGQIVTNTANKSESQDPSALNASPSNIAQKDQAILAQVGVEKSDLQQYSPLSTLYDLDKDDPKGMLTVRPHQPMYVLPVFYNANPNRKVKSPNRAEKDYSDSELMNLDSKMQISVKTKLFQDVFGTNADVWAGYTQQSYWQVYNRHSRPFRGSDYQPEFFITQPVKASLPMGGDLRVLGAGVVHQSNGQGDPLSRSWNRAYLMGGAEWGKLTIVPRLWFIFPEDKKTSDNPDIGDFMGYGDMRFLYNLGEKNTLGGLVRYNPATSKGAVQLDYARPISGGLKGYIQIFHGYGENIQDYNHLNTTIGLGIMFNDFLGL